MRKWHKLDHQPLNKQWLFWLAIGVPAAVSLALMIVWFKHTVDFSPSGYSYFFENSKLPFGILAAGVAAAAFVASIHRSIQTAKQIEETQAKNTADLYYAHLNFFIGRLEGNLLVESPIELHRDLYPHLSYKSYNLDKNNSIAESITTTLRNSTSRMNSYLREAGKSSPFFNMLKILSDEINSNDYLTNVHLLKYLHSKKTTEKLLERIEMPENRMLLDKTFSNLNALTTLVNM